ncbi:MAG TPA: glycosyltransferase, partial [Candidatus Bathyarchaeia archaeon]|nr:glycosyltransferase [Candidatus Bathyarchaeia archaeon]
MALVPCYAATVSEAGPVPARSLALAGCEGARPEVSVVLPLYNEQATVAALHARLSAVLGRAVESYELIFVDDGSRDETFAALARLCDSDPRVQAISL